MDKAIWHAYYYGAFAALLLAIGHGHSFGFAIFMAIGSWGSVTFNVLARVLP